jgi:hypothetical protein
MRSASPHASAVYGVEGSRRTGASAQILAFADALCALNH